MVLINKRRVVQIYKWYVLIHCFTISLLLVVFYVSLKNLNTFFLDSHEIHLIKSTTLEKKVL
jgi:hypothetical protein